MNRTTQFATSIALTVVALQASGCADADPITIDQPPMADVAIVGGQPATTDQIAATVALIYNNQAHCTGTLIQPQVVVTAAHCLVDPETGQTLEPQSMHIGAGALDLHQAAPNAFHPAAAIAVHGGYQGTAIQTSDPDGMGEVHDIGLVFTSTPIATLPVAPIAPMESIDVLLPQGGAVIISGYGFTSTNFNEPPLAQLYIAQAPYVRRTATELFAGGPGYADTCSGDSGGPVYAISASNEVFLVGATSRSGASATTACGDGGVYTLLPAYASWISDAIAQVSGHPGTPPDQPTFTTSGGSTSQDDDDDDDDDRSSGCSIATPGGGTGAGLLLMVLALFGLRRRRSC